MTRKQFFAWWSYPEKNPVLTDFQKQLRIHAYTRYVQSGYQRFLKPHEPNYGTGTDFPPGYQPPVAKAPQSVGKGQPRRRFKIKIRAK